MKRVFTLFFLFITCYLYPQDTIWCNRNPPPMLIPKAPSLENGFTGKVAGLIINSQNNDTAKKGTTIRFSCMRTFTGDILPLLIVDGRQKELKFLAEINPAKIESLDILKPAPATTIFGSQGVNGAIVIKTGELFGRKFIIRDSLSGEPVARATILFTPLQGNMEQFQFAANDSGVVVSEKLKLGIEYIMTVSAVGYRTWDQAFENNYQSMATEVLLSRKIETCDEVVISGYGITCNRRTLNHCGVKIENVSAPLRESKEIANAETKQKFLSLYPNPVESGASVNLAFSKPEQGEYQLQMINLSGQKVLHLEMWIDAEAKLLSIDIPHVPAGNYFLTLFNKKSCERFTERLILQ